MCCRAEGSEFAGTAGEPAAENAVDMSLPAMERYKTRDELEAFYDTDYDTLMRDIKVSPHLRMGICVTFSRLVPG